MRILHVTKKYLDVMGGDTVVVSNLIKQQTKEGHETYILTSNCDNIKNIPNLTKFGSNIDYKELDRINIKRIISLIDLYLKSFKLLKKINPSVVHTHSQDMAYFISFACKKYKIPLVHTCHGVSFNDRSYSFFKRFSEKFFLKHSKAKIITVDENSLEEFKKEGMENVVYLPNGIDLELFRQKRARKNNKIRFIFVGRLEKQKGLTYLIKAVAKLKEKYKNFKVILIGEGSEKEHLKQLINQLNLKEYFVFLGKKNQDETINQYYSSDIFILPSVWEGFPLTILEAWGVRLPVIITNVGGISKICKDKENAIIVKPKQPKELAESMKLLMNDNKLRKKLGNNGRKLVEDKYNWYKISEDLEKIYQEVLNETHTK